MDRARFLALQAEGLYSMTELCARFGVSRKTGYKWLARFTAHGWDGLADHSRRPHACPRHTTAAVEAALVQLRQTHPHWGPKKLVALLARSQPDLALPAPSTVGTILRRHDLVAARPHRRKPTHPGRSSVVAAEPNAVWQADYKGEFRLGNGQYCYPLTVTDAYSRYLLACQSRRSTATEGAQPVFQRLFAEYGLPGAIRTDNGAPFATPALGGLSRLSVWWIKLGIQHQRIEPGHPEQNGRHERLHRTLKAETTRPPAPDEVGQQARFDGFREEFNTERPHEALAQETPRTHYRPATRSLPTHLPSPEYAGHLEIRRVGASGAIRWGGRSLFLSHVLVGEDVGLEEIDEGLWSVYFYQVLLGRFQVADWRLLG
jgi:transposase InsO family protein